MEEIKINEISGDKMEAIKRQSPAALPDNPSESGMRPNTIKRAFWTPHEKTFDLINKIVAAINEAFGKVVGEIDAANGQIDNLGEKSESVNKILDSVGKSISECYGAIKAIEFSSQDASLKCSPIEGGPQTVPLPFGSMITRIRYSEEDGQLLYKLYNDDSEHTVDLPFEKLLASGSYDHETREIYLIFEDGTKLSIPVGDLVDEYSGDGETVDVFRDGASRKIRLHNTFKADYGAVKQKAEQAYETALNGNFVYANAVKGEASGQARRIDDLSPLPHRLSFSVKGVSTQASEPSTEGGTVTVEHSKTALRLCGRNILIKSNIGMTKSGITIKSNHDGSVSVSGTATEDITTANLGFTIQEPGSKITALRRGVTYRASVLDASGKRVTSGANLRFCQGTGGGYGSLFTSIAESFEYSNDKKEFNGRIVMYLDSISAGTTVDQKYYPMLEIYNGEADVYEPCSEQTFALPQLAGNGDHRDEIVVDALAGTIKLVKRYEKYEFTGDEVWVDVDSSYSNTTRLGKLDIFGSLRVKTGATGAQLCDALPCKSIYSSDVEGVYVGSPSGGDRIQVFARIPVGLEFNEVFKAGTAIYYPLETEIETDCTDEDWARALLSHITNGETMTFDSDAIVTVKYARDVNKTIQRLTEAVVALGGTI